MTDKERRFWEACGFTFEPITFKSGGGFYEHEEYIIYPNGEKYRITKGDYPDVNSLDNLMKYGLPAVIEKIGIGRTVTLPHGWIELTIPFNKDPVKALFEALCQEVEG